MSEVVTENYFYYFFRNVVLTSSILAIIAIIFVAAAIVNDVVGYYRISQLSGCYNVKTGEGSGTC